MFLSRWIVLVAGLWACLPNGRAQESFGERLGWQPDQVVVVLHCNDGGMMQGTGWGIKNAISKGVATSYSVMMPCPWVPSFMKARPTESSDIGLEVTLTSEFDLFRWGPLSGKPTVPSLVDPEGCLWKTVPQLAAKANPDDVEREIRAQLERATNFGAAITHFTAHDGAVYAKSEFFERYLKVAMEKGIPPVLAGGHMQYMAEENSPLIPLMKSKATDLWNAGFPVVDDIVMQVESWNTGEKRSKLEAMLHSLRPGVTVIVFHPATSSDEMRVIMQNSGSRIQDNMVLTDFGIKRVIENRKIVLTDFIELQKRRKKAKPIGK